MWRARARAHTSKHTHTQKKKKETDPHTRYERSIARHLFLLPADPLAPTIAQPVMQTNSTANLT